MWAIEENKTVIPKVAFSFSLLEDGNMGSSPEKRKDGESVIAPMK